MPALLSLAFTLLLIIAPSSLAANSPSRSADSQQILSQYQTVELGQFIDQNQIPERMVAKKQRVMLPLSTVQFDARLMQQPKPGKFSLVYDALSLWPNDQPKPVIDHSAFLQAQDGRVISTYVTQQAAAQLQALVEQANQIPFDCHLYAVHIYNYAKGPRLIVIAAEASGNR